MDVLGAASIRVLRAVATLGGDEVGLAEIVAHVGGHPNTTRQQLYRLVRSGHVDVVTGARGRPGRPPKLYSLTVRGRRAVSSDPYAGLLTAVSTHLADQPDPHGSARAMGESWGSASAATMAGEPVSAVVELLDILGFEPRPDGDDVVLTRCPLLGDGDHAPLMCELHQGMLDGALRELGRAEGVSLTPFSHPEGCGVRFGETHH